MNADQVEALRVLLAPTGWLDRARSFGRALRESARTPQGLLVIGTPADEPWHLAAHLADESKLAEIPELAPTLIRWSPPATGPRHLRIGVERLQAASRDETLLVVSPQAAPADLLERLGDARRLGVTIFALDQGDAELEGLAHEALPVRPSSSPVSFDAAQHLVSAAAGEPQQPRGEPRHRGHPARDGTGRQLPGAASHSLRGRLARLLDAVSGTPAD